MLNKISDSDSDSEYAKIVENEINLKSYTSLLKIDTQ